MNKKKENILVNIFLQWEQKQTVRSHLAIFR